MYKMFALIVHDSDEVKDVFIGFTKEEILTKLRDSKYWEDITNRLEEEFVPISDGDDEEGEEFNIDSITLDDAIQLYHDGDSEDGYTLLTAK